MQREAAEKIGSALFGPPARDIMISMASEQTESTTTERRQLPIRLPVEQYEALKSYAFFTHTSMNEAVCLAVQQFLDGPARADELKAITARAQAQYRGALDKLKEL